MEDKNFDYYFGFVRQVLAHGSTKHDTIEPFLVQLEHAKSHWVLSKAVETEKESGLPHVSHCLARLLLALETCVPDNSNTLNITLCDLLNGVDCSHSTDRIREAARSLAIADKRMKEEDR